MLLSNLYIAILAGANLPLALGAHKRPLYPHRRWTIEERMSMFEVERDGGSHRVNVGTTPQTRQVQDLWSRDNLTEWKRQSCSEGQWQCSGQELQQCNWGSWVQMAMCDGQTTLCVADNPNAAPGCVWASSVLSGGGAISNADPASPSASWSQSPASSAVPSPAASAGSVVMGGGPTGQYAAPHYVLYQDRYTATLPTASSLTPWNRFLLAFWLTSGPADMAETWTQISAADQQSTLQDYHDNGIALMVSAFGSSNYPTSSDPTSTAQQLASFVKQNNLDGVDIDYEDSGAFIAGTAEPWLITFTQELRNQLPSPYLISHAPQPPYMVQGQFTSKGGGYNKINQEVGDLIDFYNVQYYNQGSTTNYQDCNSIVVSDSGTAILEISANLQIPLNKLVMGKPLNSGDASNTGYIEPSSLAQCYSLAESKGWNAGVMAWQWDTSAQAWLQTVLGQ